MIKVDMSDLEKVIDDIDEARRRVWPEVVDAARTSAEALRDNARTISAGSRKGIPNTIRAVVSKGDQSVTARVEYGSPLGAILEFGTPTSPAYAALGPSLDREGPAFVEAVEAALDRAFR